MYSSSGMPEFIIFEIMQQEEKEVALILKEELHLDSAFLGREVTIGFYIPRGYRQGTALSLLLINDGQDMTRMDFRSILEDIYRDNQIEPILFAAVHAGEERKLEYGTQRKPDYLKRGSKAPLYTSFIFDELIPFIRQKFGIDSFKEKAFAGFSLGGLSALDIVWNRPGEFTRVGVFSGSFWWRSLDQEDKDYADNKHRIMHQEIREGTYAPWLKFFFQCGQLDELKDRNHNGIIDSIDDTQDLIRELEIKGYQQPQDIHYLEMEDGTHDVDTWGRAMPEFLKWGWSVSRES